MQSNVTHILPLVKIRRSRILPIPGTVLVRTGQKVEATDLIAEANLEPKHILLDIAKGLGVSPEKAEDYLQRKIGDQVAKDGIIADRHGTGRVVRAPEAGKVVTISKGKLLLQINEAGYQILAGMSGIVKKINAEYGAEIETSGALIQGIWGNDRMFHGNLSVLAENPDHILSIEEINIEQSGAVIYAGYCNDPTVLSAGETNQWGGLILGSMSTPLIPFALKMPYPIIVLEGFGHLEINEKTHKLITTSEGREVTLNSMRYSPTEGIRPEITIPLPSKDLIPIPLETQLLENGVQVRILRSPYMGKTGIFNKLLPGMTRFPSGIKTPGAEIKLSNKEKVLVPLANIEVLG